MAADFIVDVNDENFEYEVITYSANLPVLVDFWAEWCRPCKLLTPVLEKIVQESRGSFRLARVDVDASPNLAALYGVRSIPAVKAFSQGEVVAQFSGNLPEAQVREFIARITPPSPLNLKVEKASGLLGMRRWQEAEDLFRETLEHDPNQPESLLGLVIALLGRGESAEAEKILSGFPASKQYTRAARLQPLARWMNASRRGELPVDEDLDAAFANSLRLAARGNQPAALDGLLDILRQEKRFRGGRARDVILGLLEVLGDDDTQARAYRSELSQILF